MHHFDPNELESENLYPFYKDNNLEARYLSSEPKTIFDNIMEKLGSPKFKQDMTPEVVLAEVYRIRKLIETSRKKRREQANKEKPNQFSGKLYLIDKTRGLTKREIENIYNQAKSENTYYPGIYILVKINENDFEVHDCNESEIGNESAIIRYNEFMVGADSALLSKFSSAFHGNEGENFVRINQGTKLFNYISHSTQPKSQQIAYKKNEDEKLKEETLKKEIFAELEEEYGEKGADMIAYTYNKIMSPPKENSKNNQIKPPPKETSQILHHPIREDDLKIPDRAIYLHKRLQHDIKQTKQKKADEPISIIESILQFNHYMVNKVWPRAGRRPTITGDNPLASLEFKNWLTHNDWFKRLKKLTTTISLTDHQKEIIDQILKEIYSASDNWIENVYALYDSLDGHNHTSKIRECIDQIMLKVKTYQPINDINHVELRNNDPGKFCQLEICQLESFSISTLSMLQKKLLSIDWHDSKGAKHSIDFSDYREMWNPRAILSDQIRFVIVNATDGQFDANSLEDSIHPSLPKLSASPYPVLIKVKPPHGGEPRYFVYGINGNGNKGYTEITLSDDQIEQLPFEHLTAVDDGKFFRVRNFILSPALIGKLKEGHQNLKGTSVKLSDYLTKTSYELSTPARNILKKIQEAHDPTRQPDLVLKQVAGMAFLESIDTNNNKEQKFYGSIAKLINFEETLDEIQKEIKTKFVDANKKTAVSSKNANSRKRYLPKGNLLKEDLFVEVPSGVFAIQEILDDKHKNPQEKFTEIYHLIKNKREEFFTFFRAHEAKDFYQKFESLIVLNSDNPRLLEEIEKNNALPKLGTRKKSESHSSSHLPNSYSNLNL